MLSKLLSTQYLFGPTIPGFSRSDHYFLNISVILIAIGILLMLLTYFVSHPVQKKFVHRLTDLALTIGILSLLWTGLRYELVQYLSMHFLVLLVYLIGAIWFGFIVRLWFKNYRAEHNAYEREKLRQKYMNI